MSHINFRKKYVWFMIATFSLLTACGGGDDETVEGTSAVPPQQTPSPSTPPGPESDVIPANPSNPIEAHGWCRIEDWDSFQVVMRAVARDNQMQIEYLRLTPGAPTVYPFGGRLPYEMRHHLSVIDKNVFTITYRDNVAEIKTLFGYDKQKEIVETKLSQNPDVLRDAALFEPATAITVMNRSLTTGDEDVRHFYPCEQYSNYFELNGTVRPAIEMNLFLAWNVEDFVGNPRENELANSMILQLPIQEIQLSPSELDQTQWCSWHQVGMGDLFLRTLTFAGNRYISNAHSQYFNEINDEGRIMAYLENNAKYSDFYEMTRPQARIGGTKIKANGRSEYDPEELFASVQDGNGTRALVRLNVKNPDDSWPAFIDIYYDCKDPRPLAFSPAFGSRIQTILNLQLSQQYPSPEPTPTPDEPTPEPPATEPAPEPGSQPETPEPQP